MRRHHIRLRLGGVIVAGGVLVLAAGAPAAAELTGPCAASGNFHGSGVVTANPDATVDVASSGAHEIPPSGVVDWNGSVTRGSEARPHSGFVTIDTSIDDLFEFLSVDMELNTW